VAPSTLHQYRLNLRCDVAALHGIRELFLINPHPNRITITIIGTGRTSLNLTLEQYERLNRRCEVLHYGVRIDQLVTSYELPVPDHITIDVDGIEPNIITGAEVLRNPKVRSLLIEINLNLEDHRQMLEKLTGLGSKVARQQVERAGRNIALPFKPNGPLVYDVYVRQNEQPQMVVGQSQPSNVSFKM